MRRNHIRVLLAAPLLMGLTVACNTRVYDNCPSDRTAGLWGVLCNSEIFGSCDSIYFMVNPIGNISDSLYFNANYTDSYYRADSTRVSLAYGPLDSVRFYFQRMYAVEMNPPVILADVKVVGDTSHVNRSTKLKMRRAGNSDELYIADYDSTFIEMLKLEKPLYFWGENGPGSSNSQGTQCYEWIIYTEGFGKARQLCDSLNDPVAFRASLKKEEAAKDSLEKKDSLHHKEHHKHHHFKL